MPWRSRIESEFVRRAVLAGLLVMVLGLCTVMAVGVSPASRLQSGVFRWTAPPLYAIERRFSEMHVELTAPYGRQPRVLHVMMLPNNEPRPPLEARREAMERLTPVAQWVDTRQGRVDSLRTYSWVGKSPVVTGNGRMGTRTQWLTVATPDNRHYLVVYLFTFGEPNRRDFTSHQRLLDSVTLSEPLATSGAARPNGSSPETGDDSPS